MALDLGGNPIVTGLTASTDFPVTADCYDDSYAATDDVFIAQLSAAGNALYCGTYAGGSSQERGWTVRLDSGRDPVVVGHTESSGFPTTAGAYDESFNGNWDAFVLKMYMGLAHSSAHGSEDAAALRFSVTPNPFTGMSLLGYTLTHEETVLLRVFDPAGRAVTTLFQGTASPGTHRLVGSGRDDQGLRLPAGVYFIDLVAGETTAQGRITIVK